MLSCRIRCKLTARAKVRGSCHRAIEALFNPLEWANRRARRRAEVRTPGEAILLSRVRKAALRFRIQPQQQSDIGCSRVRLSKRIGRGSSEHMECLRDFADINVTTCGTFVSKVDTHRSCDFRCRPATPDHHHRPRFPQARASGYKPGRDRYRRRRRNRSPHAF